MRGEGYIYKHVNAYKTKMYLMRRSIVKDSINVNATRLLNEMKKRTLFVHEYYLKVVFELRNELNNSILYKSTKRKTLFLRCDVKMN